MASEKITAIIEELKTLTVLELSELVKAIEEEFGVSAAAAVAVAAPAAGGAAAAEEKSEFDVVLANAGAEKIKQLAKKKLKKSRLSFLKLALLLNLSNLSKQVKKKVTRCVTFFYFIYYCLLTPQTPTIIKAQQISCGIDNCSCSINIPASTDTTVIIFEKDEARTALIFVVA